MKEDTYISVTSIIRNRAGLYEGDLIYYFREVLMSAQNLHEPYHNFRHMLHVTVACYRACEYYKHLSKRSMRNLLIAALFHDFNHSGMQGSDDLNIERSIRALKECLLPEDKNHFNAIASLIRSTEYPYKVRSEDESFYAQILRDADVSQALDRVWIQQVVLGLGSELGKSPVEMLRAQLGFLNNLRFHTDWARARFPREIINLRIDETQDLLDLLENK